MAYATRWDNPVFRSCFNLARFPNRIPTVEFVRAVEAASSEDRIHAVDYLREVQATYERDQIPVMAVRIFNHISCILIYEEEHKQ